MNRMFEARLAPRITGPIVMILVRVDDASIDDYLKCVALLEEKFPEYELLSVLEGYKDESTGRST